VRHPSGKCPPQPRSRRLGIGAAVAAPAALLALGIGAGTTITLGAGSGRRLRLNDPADTSGPLDVRGAQLGQAGRKLVLSVSTAGAWSLSQLDAQPNLTDPATSFLCFALRPAGASGETRICPGGGSGRVGVLKVTPAGTVGSAQAVAARVEQTGATRTTISLLPEDAGLRPGAYRWYVSSQWSGPGCQPPAGSSSCGDRAPDTGTAPFLLRPVGPVGCTRRGPELNFNGPRKGRAVALTFDDGPSDYTASVLRILRTKHATGTFFEIGQEIGGHQRTLRSILASGDEIGNHTTHHSASPGYADLAHTNRLIERATGGFTPCLFRPPGGALSSGNLAAAREAHLKTIIWDVDPQDWSRPGSGAIYSRVVGTTHPGSIILMHDGGGDRSETVSALPQIIDTLRHRGYAFKTVTQLLGDRMIYGPVG